MSINEIVNYVNRTPHNTNPSVIASMVQGANEQAVYESVEELKRNGGVGYTENGRVYTYDGNKNGKPVIEDYLVKISDTPIDVNKVESLKFGGVTATRENFTLVNDSYVSAIMVDNVSLVISVPKDASVDADFAFTRGLWVVHFPTGNYVSEVVCEIIHPIDPKYIPEGFIVINVNDYGIYFMEILSSGETITKFDGVSLIDYVWQVFQSGRIPIIHDEAAQMWVMPSGFNQMQFTGSLVGAIGDAFGKEYVKADIVILPDEIALFTTMLS